MNCVKSCDNMSFYRKIIFVLPLLVCSFMISCGKSIEEDAKEAAKLTLKSLEYVASRDLDKSEDAYKRSQEIQQKYANDSEAFYNLYMTFLEQNKKNN